VQILVEPDAEMVACETATVEIVTADDTVLHPAVVVAVTV
jgi:hypothetical protein